MYRIIGLFIILLLLLPQFNFAQLEAGVARINVTPPIGGPMYGYDTRGENVSQGVHDSLYAKALVLYDGKMKLAIVTLDLGRVTQENTMNIKNIVRKHTAIDQIILVVSHSHSTSSPRSDFPSEENPWIREEERKIAEAIIEADKNLMPAQIGVGWGEIRESFNRRVIKANGEAVMLWENRDRMPTNPIDYQLGVIKIDGAKGNIATLVNFACHPVVLGPENLMISADYPGEMMRIVKDEIGGQVMFLQGAAGDINPFWDKTPLNEGAYEQMKKMGSAIAEEVKRVANNIISFDDEIKLSIQTEIISLASRKDMARINRNINAEINTILIGDAIALATFPGEFFVEHGLNLKSNSPIKHTFFVGYCNDALGYFPTIQATIEGGYGAMEATKVEVGAGERLVNRALINLLYQADKISNKEYGEYIIKKQ